MPLGVPAQRRDAVTHADVQVFQRIGDLFRGIEQISISRADDIALHAACDDFTIAVDRVRVFKNLVNREWPVLHDAEHRVSSMGCASDRRRFLRCPLLYSRYCCHARMRSRGHVEICVTLRNVAVGVGLP